MDGHGAADLTLFLPSIGIFSMIRMEDVIWVCVLALEGGWMWG